MRPTPIPKHAMTGILFSKTQGLTGAIGYVPQLAGNTTGADTFTWAARSFSRALLTAGDKSTTVKALGRRGVIIWVRWSLAVAGSIQVVTSSTVSIMGNR